MSFQLLSLIEQLKHTTVNNRRSSHRSSYKQMDIIVFHVPFLHAGPFQQYSSKLEIRIKFKTKQPTHFI